MKCKNCRFSPVYLGNKCPECGVEVIKGKNKQATREKSTKKTFSKDKFTIDIENIERLCGDLKLAKSPKGRFEKYIKLAVFIEEVACKINFDEIDEIEDLIIALEKNSAERISLFFSKILPKLDNSDGDFHKVISVQKQKLDAVLNDYNTILKQNNELQNLTKELESKNESIKLLQSNIEQLKNIQKNIENNDINTLTYDTNQIASKLNIQLSEKVASFSSNVREFITVAEKHAGANSDILEALKETFKTIETNKKLDSKLLLLYDNILPQIQRINLDLSKFDDLLKFELEN